MKIHEKDNGNNLKTISIIDDENQTDFLVNTISNTVFEVYNYKNDKLHGDVLKYNNKGILITKSSYINGFRNGIYQSFNYEGKLLHEKTFINGMEHGMSKVFDENGNIIFEAEYRNDKLHKIITDNQEKYE